MTSKEMEACSGVPRANIRYYEAEGLLTPARAKNGYRDYSEEDLAVLEKIKLLRRLGVTVEELKALQAGSAELSAVLDRRLAELGGEQGTLERVERVCGDLRQAGATFEPLDANQYLTALEAPVLPAASEETWWATLRTPPLPADTLPTVCNPFRRLAARGMDGVICFCMVWVPLRMAGYQSHGGLAVFAVFLALLLMLSLEPLFLHFFAATPGKFLLGLRLTRPDGTKLSYGQGVNRLMNGFVQGLGCCIPIWSLIQLYRCVKRCIDEDPQPWDEDVAYHARGGTLRWITPVLALIVLFQAGKAAKTSVETLPPNQGDLTVEEFTENFWDQEQIFYSSYFDWYFGEMEVDGTFRQAKTDPWGEEIFWKTIDFHYETGADGHITAVIIRAEGSYQDKWIQPKLPLSIPCAVAAFTWAREDAPFWLRSREKFLEELEKHKLEDFTIHEAGVVLTCEADVAWDDWTEFAANACFVTFTIALEE